MAVKVLQSELKTREATPAEQTELDDRSGKIARGEMKDEELFDKEEPVIEGKPEEKKEEPKKEEKKIDNTGLTDAELIKADDKDLNDEQKSRKSDLAEAKKVAEVQEEEERILNAEEKDLNDEEKVKKAELVKVKDGNKSEEEKKKAFDEEVKSYSTEHEVSEEDARKDLESIGKIVDNFKGDARKVAKSFHHLQKTYTRTTEELKALKNAPPPIPHDQTMRSIISAIEDGNLTLKGQKASKEEIAQAFREKNPELGDDVNDETVIKIFAKRMVEGYESKRKDNLAKLSVDAKEKKAQLINELSDEDKKFLPVIKPVLDNHTDMQIMSDAYSLDDYVAWAKGKDSDRLVKEADARGFKRGVEARKIIGEIKKPGEGGAPPKSKDTSETFGLSDDEKVKAEEMYSHDNIPLKRKYELYAEIVEHDKKLTKDKEEKEKK